MQEEIKHKVLLQALKIIPFEGWSREMMRQASIKAGQPEKTAELIFLDGPMSLLDYYLSDLDQHMVKQIKLLPLSKMKVRDKIKQALIIRLGLLKKPVASRTVSYLTLPFNIPQALSFTWRTVDLIWYEAGGDTATDFNHYTKRTLLAGVYNSTLLYWLNDESKDHKDTLEFLDRRIENVMQIGMCIHKAQTFKKS